MSGTREHKLAVAQSELDELKQRLIQNRLPEAETVADWTQGIPLAYVKELRDYWIHNYDWRRCEDRLNSFPQYVATIDNIDIHFLHIESTRESAKPLILTHGWPGSVIEFLDVIKPLTDPPEDQPAFSLVVPSLPGFGFSSKPKAPGCGVQTIAALWDKLMVGLGYSKYYAQGGDWGAAVTTTLAADHAENCIGMHTNMPSVGPDRDTMDDLTPLEQEALKGSKFYQDWDSGYSKQQSTRPQTLGYGLVDSPVGQMAWIIEKFYQWTDCQGHPENVLTKDQLLDNVMLYWLPASGASSGRLYWESFGRGGSTNPVDVPSGISVFPKEIFKASERWAKRRYKNLVYYNVLEKGGHFAAFEQPAIFTQELRQCFSHM